MKALIFLTLTLLFFNVASAEDLYLEHLHDFHHVTSSMVPFALISEENIIYALSTSGLEIYLINTDGSLTLTSRLDIDYPLDFVKHQDNIFILKSPTLSDYSIAHKINVENINSPFIQDSITLFTENPETWHSPDYIKIVNNHLLIQYTDSNVNNTYPCYYFCTDTLEIVHEDYNLMVYETIFDSLIIRLTQQNIWSIYDMSDITAPELIGTFDSSEYFSSHIPMFQFYDDDIVIASQYDRINIFDISDITEWLHLSTIYLDYGFTIKSFDTILRMEDFIVTSSQGTRVAAYNITDWSDIFLVDYIDIWHDVFVGNVSFCFYEENVYLFSNDNGILHFSILDNNIEYFSKYLCSPPPFTLQNLSNYMMVSYFLNGINLYDVSDPYSPQIVASFKEERLYENIIANNNILYWRYFDLEEYTSHNHLYLLNDSLDLILLQEFPLSTSLHFDKHQPDHFYTQDYGAISKYFIDRENLEINYQYSVETNQNYSSLLIYDNFIMGKTVHSQFTPLFIYFDDGSSITYLQDSINLYNPRIRGDYLIDRSTALRIYSISELPSVSLVHEYPNRAFSCYIYDNLAFIERELWTYIEAYDFNTSGYNLINPIALLDLPYYNISMFFLESDDFNYIFTSTHASIRVSRYKSSTPTDDELPLLPQALSQNYPNPFHIGSSASRNVGTNIDFHLEEAQQVSLKIFNIKGQLVKSLTDEYYSPGKHTISWDGKDNRGRTPGTGIYLYKLKGETINETRKMMILRE